MREGGRELIQPVRRSPGASQDTLEGMLATCRSTVENSDLDDNVERWTKVAEKDDAMLAKQLW